MKRFTETEKWNDLWFRSMDQEQKLFWLYLCDRCDNAGVWPVDWELVSFHTGVRYDAKEILAAFGDRVRDIGRDRWWVPKLVPFQFGELVPASRVHQSVVNLMRKHGIHSLFIAYTKGVDRDQEKVQAKEKDASGKGTGENQARGGRPDGEIPSLESVKGCVMGIGIPDEFVALVYETWIQRAGKDGAGVPVEIVGYVRSRWVREQAEWKNGTHRFQKGANGSSKQNSRQGANRNAGTLNDPSRYSAENLRKLPNYHAQKPV